MSSTVVTVYPEAVGFDFEPGRFRWLSFLAIVGAVIFGTFAATGRVGGPAEENLGPLVPYRWLVLGTGSLGLIYAFLANRGLLLPPVEGHAGNLAFAACSLALFVGGFIACFLIPPLQQRIDQLEQLLAELERKQQGSRVATELVQGAQHTS